MGGNAEKTLVDSVLDGDQLEMYESLRLSLARQLRGTESGRDMAALSKQFIEVTERIEQIKKTRPDKNRRTPLDEIRSKREKKASPAKGKPRAKS